MLRPSRRTRLSIRLSLLLAGLCSVGLHAQTASSAANGLAAEVSGIVADASLSRIKKEQKILAAVRAAISGATADKHRSVEVLNTAMDLAEAAAGAGPEFTETIARAAAFAPRVANISKGPAQVRAAAYAGAKNAKGGQASMVPAPMVAAAPVSAPVAPVSTIAVSVPSSQPATSVFAAAAPSSATSTAPATPPPPAASEPAPAPTAPVPFTVPPIVLPMASADATTPAAGDENVVRMSDMRVEGSVIKGSSTDLRNERARANVAIDTLSADQLLKYGVGDLSEVVFRIPGVSVANGQFAVVRGLSDRFLSTTLQGIKLPSPDPEKQAMQLDLLPTSAIEAVVVAKTYEATQWAESAGGNMDIRTRAIPEEGMFRLSLGLKVNANAQEGGLDYRINGETDERFGFGSKSRLDVNSSDPEWQYVPTQRKSFPVGNKVAMEYARAFQFSGEQQLGVLISAFNEASYKAESGRRSTWLVAPGQPARPATSSQPAFAGVPNGFEKSPRQPSTLDSVYLYQQSESEYVSSAALGLGYRISADHEIKFSGLFVQSGIDQAQVNETELEPDPVTGKLRLRVMPYLNLAPDSSWFQGHEYFRERNLTIAQLSGEHTLSAVGDLKVHWAAQHGRSSQKDHPFIETVFDSPLADLYNTYEVRTGSDVPTPIYVTWANNKERQKAGNLDFSLPLKFWNEDALLRFGGAVDNSERDASGFTRYGTSQRLVQGDDPNELWSGVGTFRFPSENNAERKIRGYYIDSTLPIHSKLKLIGGARFEDFSLAVQGVGRWANYLSTTLYDDTPGGGQFGKVLSTKATGNPPFQSEKWYPGVGLIFKPVDSVTVRLAYSTTSGRPSFREVSPFFNKSIDSGNLVIGNPALRPAGVKSYDARIEWNPNRTNSISFSVFEKRIQDPIEKIILDTRAAAAAFTETWVNNPTEAKLKGFEAEFRHNLGAWSDTLKNFTVSGNFTSLDAKVNENPFVITSVTSAFQDPAKIPSSRRLFDQPEYIGNLDLTWSNSRTGTSVSVSGYAISDTLTAAGLSGLTFDLYERSYARYDLVFNQQLTAGTKLRLTLKNISDPVRGTIYDREATDPLFVRQEYRAGREYGLSVSTDF